VYRQRGDTCATAPIGDPNQIGDPNIMPNQVGDPNISVALNPQPFPPAPGSSHERSRQDQLPVRNDRSYRRSFCASRDGGGVFRDYGGAG